MIFWLSIKMGNTILHYAARSPPLLEYLLEHRRDEIADINITNNEGSTILHNCNLHDEHASITLLASIPEFNLNRRNQVMVYISINMSHLICLKERSNCPAYLHSVQ